MSELIDQLKKLADEIKAEPWPPYRDAEGNWTAKDELRHRLNCRLQGMDPGPPNWSDLK